MKLKFKKQGYQTHAVDAVADCFAGQIFKLMSPGTEVKCI